MDSPLYRALITFIPASQIPGWRRNAPGAPGPE